MVIKLDWSLGSVTWPWNGKGLFTGQVALPQGTKLDFTLTALRQDGQILAQQLFPQTEIRASGDLRFPLTVDEVVLQTHVTDTEAPTPGEGGALKVSDVRGTSLRIRYTPAIDNLSFAHELRYAVYVADARESLVDPNTAASKTRIVQDWGPVSNAIMIMPGTMKAP